MSSRVQSKENDFSAVLITIFKAVTAGVIISALLLLLFSFLMSKKDIPLMLINPFTSMLLAISSFFSGYTAAHQLKKRGMVVGAGCGALIFMLVMLFSMMESFSVGITALIKLAISVISGASGGVMGVNTKRVRK